MFHQPCFPWPVTIADKEINEMSEPRAVPSEADMPDIVTTRIEHPFAWQASSFSSLDDVAVALTPEQRASLAALGRKVCGEGRVWSDLTPDEEALPELAATLADVHREVYQGRGLVLLRGLPMEELDEDQAAVVAWAVGSHFGRRATQSALGDVLGRVQVDPNLQQAWRGYRSSNQSRFHTDHLDGLGLLCVRPAGNGGESCVVSSAAIHNVLSAERPDLLPVLYQGFRMAWFGEPPAPGEKVTNLDVPVFSWSEGRIVCVMLPSYQKAAAEEMGVPLPEGFEEACALIHEIALRDGMALKFKLAAGDMLVIDNKAVLHGRAAFAEDPGDIGHRLLYRLQFELLPERPSHPGVACYYGDLKHAYHDDVEFRPRRTRASAANVRD